MQSINLLSSINVATMPVSYKEIVIVLIEDAIKYNTITTLLICIFFIIERQLFSGLADDG